MEEDKEFKEVWEEQGYRIIKNWINNKYLKYKALNYYTEKEELIQKELPKIKEEIIRELNDRLKYIETNKLKYEYNEKTYDWMNEYINEHNDINAALEYLEKIEREKNNY